MAQDRKHFLIQQSKLSETPETVWALLTQLGCYRRIAPPWQKITQVITDRKFTLGAGFSFKIGNGLLKGRWAVEVTHLRPGFLIGLRLTSPTGKPWQIWTKVLPGETKAECILEDRVEYLSSPLVGKTQKKIEQALRGIIYYKHRTLKNDLAVSKKLGKVTHPRVLVAGGTGFIGTRLREYLTLSGYEVEVLSTNPESGNLYWDPFKGLLDPGILEKRDAIINLCGYPVACRWSKKNRKRILDSRINATHLLVKTIARLEQPPEVFVQASGVGYYGYDNPTDVTETTPQGDGFLAEVCQRWEAEVANLEKLPVRTVVTRLGAVISPQGGALAKMLPVFRFGLGGKLGSGKQYFPWVSINDLVYLLRTALEDTSYKGIFNACSIETPDNRSFTRALGSALRVPTVLPAPSFLLRLRYGTMAKEMLLGGAQVVPHNAVERGFEFYDTSINENLQIFLGK